MHVTWVMSCSQFRKSSHTQTCQCFCRKMYEYTNRDKVYNKFYVLSGQFFLPNVLRSGWFNGNEIEDLIFRLMLSLKIEYCG